MLTEKQQKVVDEITDFIAKYGKSPTIEELRLILWQKSKRGVTQYLEALEKKWFLSRVDWYRGIRLGNSVGLQTTLNIPILWYANAGTPLVEAKQSDYWCLPISKKMVPWKGENCFVLKVEGTSMNNFEVNWKNIENGSYVLIKKENYTPNSRDAFLFIVDWKATLKKYKKDWKTIYLVPESKDEYHKPIILSENDNLEINWKVIDVYNLG